MASLTRKEEGPQWATRCRAVRGVGTTVVLVVCVGVSLRLV